MNTFYYILLAFLLSILLFDPAECAGKSTKKKKGGGGNGQKKKGQNVGEPSLKMENATEDDQSKAASSKGKSPAAGPSNTLLDAAAKQQQQARADSMREPLAHYNIRKYLDHNIALPAKNEEYKWLVDDAIKRLNTDEEGTIAQIIKMIEQALNGRRLRYIRLVGAGSLRRHNEHYNYDKDGRADHLGMLKILGSPIYEEHYNQWMQVLATYQLALTNMIAEYPPFKANLEHVTVEDAHLEKSEEKFLNEQFGYTAIVGSNGAEGNLAKIPAKVAGMVEGDATLVIMINCGLDITMPLIDSYGKQGPKQLILLESSLIIPAKKATKKPLKDSLLRNQRSFGAGHPLPNTDWAGSVFQQKGGAQLYYVEEWEKKN